MLRFTAVHMRDSKCSAFPPALLARNIGHSADFYTEPDQQFGKTSEVASGAIAMFSRVGINCSLVMPLFVIYRGFEISEQSSLNELRGATISIRG